MKIVIITEGFSGIGYGHLARCLAIYQAFEERGITPIYVADCDDIGRVFLGQINLSALDWRRKANDLARLCTDCDVVLIDSYLADTHIYEQLRKTSRRIAYLDDYLRIDYPPGVIVNGTIGAERLPYPRKSGHRYLLGVDYAPLRKDFWDLSPRIKRHKVENVLLVFGGEDARGLTGKTLRYLTTVFPEYTYHVVRGLNPEGDDDGSDSSRRRFYRNLTACEFLQLMMSCDLAVSAAGQTIYELARIGLPTIAVGTAENQRHTIRGWIENGFLQSELWWDDADLFEKLALEIRDHANPEGEPHAFLDGQGARRIAQYLVEGYGPEAPENTRG